MQQEPTRRNAMSAGEGAQQGQSKRERVVPTARLGKGALIGLCDFYIV